MGVLLCLANSLSIKESLNECSFGLSGSKITFFILQPTIRSSLKAIFGAHPSVKLWFPSVSLC